MQVNLKAIKPVGVVIILAAALLALITCFTADMGVPPEYESLHDAEYYLQSEPTMLELAAELEENVFPNLRGVTRCEFKSDTGRLAVYAQGDELDRVRHVLLRDFDERLFEFYESE